MLEIMFTIKGAHLNCVTLCSVLFVMHISVFIYWKENLVHFFFFSFKLKMTNIACHATTFNYPDHNKAKKKLFGCRPPPTLNV